MRLFLCCLAILGLLLLSGCQPTVYLMPTPQGLISGQHDPFDPTDPAAKGNQVAVAYATNRLPLGVHGDRSYLTLFDDTIRLGTAHLQIGPEDLPANALHQQSTGAKRDTPLALKLVRASEKALLPAASSADTLTPDLRAFFDEVNTALAQSASKHLLVYLHGANNNFYRSMSQAAQFHHFTGRKVVMLAFSWPSAESLLRYAVDVNNARKTVPVLVQLLDLLAAHTDAKKIDLLAYSAGAQLLSPALAQLRQDNARVDAATLRARLRLGEIYFAAPDVDFRGFLNDLGNYIDLVDNVTLAINPGDFVLGLSAFEHGTSRAGRPDPNELTPEERDLVSRKTRVLPFDVLWVDPETIPALSGGSHDFWYRHPWVSTDVLLQLLFRARPAERGLAQTPDSDARIWYFPADYAEHIDAVIQGLSTRRDAQSAHAMH